MKVSLNPDKLPILLSPCLYFPAKIFAGIIFLYMFAVLKYCSLIFIIVIMQKNRCRKLTFTPEERIYEKLVTDITYINAIDAFVLIYCSPVWFSYVVDFDLVDLISHDIFIRKYPRFPYRFFSLFTSWR